jgi:hypothetical protein
VLFFGNLLISKNNNIFGLLGLGSGLINNSKLEKKKQYGYKDLMPLKKNTEIILNF